jgi:hypothetical protein
MTRDEMLKRMGLTDHEFRSLVEKFREFYGHLNPAQQAVVHHALPRFEQAIGLFGHDIKKTDVKMMLRTADDSGGGGGFGQNGINQITNGDSGDGNPPTP